MIKERLSRRTLVKLATAPFLAPLAAACAPQTDTKIATLEAKIAQLEAEKKTPEPAELPVNIRVLQPEEFNRATEEAMRENAQPQPTLEPSPLAPTATLPEPSPTTKLEPTPKPIRPKVEIPELTQEAKPTGEKLKRQEVEQLTTLWTQKILIPGVWPSGWNPQAIFENQKRIFALSPEGYPALFDFDTGSKTWQWPNKNEFIYGIESEILYLLDPKNKELSAFNVQARRLKWQTVFQVKDNEHIWGPIHLRENIFYSIFVKKPSDKYESFWMTIDKATGKELWTNREGISCGTDQILLNLKGEGIDVLTGEKRYNLFTDSKAISPSNYICLGPHYHIAIVDKKTFVVHDLNSGKKLWERSIPAGSQFAHAPARTLYTQTSKETLFAWDKENGRQLWKFDAGAYISLIHELSDSALLVSVRTRSDAEEGKTYVLDPKSGNMVWENKNLFLNSIRLGTHNDILIGRWSQGSWGGNTLRQPDKFYGIDLRSGHIIWQLPLEIAGSKDFLLGRKILYSTKDGLRIFDVELGQIVSEILLVGTPAPTAAIATNDFIIFQTGAPGTIGNLSLVRI